MWGSFRKFGCIALMACLLAACQSHFPKALDSSARALAYDRAYPIYAELCALSQFRKRPDYPPAIVGGGFGGHAVLFLKGVCRVKDAHYPVLELCGKGEDGVGISVNAHYSNANWVATEGRDFFFRGTLAPGAALTKAEYDKTVAAARAKGILDGIEFYEEYFADMPSGTNREDFKYQISLGTDYALAYARDSYCARLPLTPEQMRRAVTALNAANAPYRSGAKQFHWNVVKDNCGHVLRNALAAAGVWDAWPAGRSLVAASLRFPVPKNEFVNLMRVTNDGPLGDVEALYDDETARETLMRDDWLAPLPGGLAALTRMVTENAVYDPKVQLVFWSDPVLGPYERRFRRILDEPRYNDMTANLRYFSGLYGEIEAARKPLSWHLAKRGNASQAEQDHFAAFYVRYYDYIGRQRAKVDRLLAETAR